MSIELLYSRSETLIAVVLLVLLVLSAEAGYRLGRSKRGRFNDATKSQLATIQAAILALLGLLLGFSFAMAASRFEMRKQMVIDEADAIGTAALRARLLPSPLREQAAALFLKYVEAGLRSSQAPWNPSQSARLDDEAKRIQEQLWSLAVTVADRDTRSVTAGLFVESLNEVLDSSARHEAALRNHVPESVLLLVIVVSITAAGAVGYGVGLAGERAAGAVLSLALIVALVVLVIVDLDRPYRGLLRISERGMLALRESLAQASREPPRLEGRRARDEASRSPHRSSTEPDGQ